MSLNTCTISGNLGRDAEIRRTASAVAVCTFSVAVGERRRNHDGSYRDEVSWVDCVMFGNRAEGIQPYLKKGTKLCVVGHLKQSEYERSGERRRKLEVIVDEVELMNTRRERQQPEGTPAPEPVSAASFYEEDIPF